eukprot:767213-Hanusia_phi.AAC.9
MDWEGGVVVGMQMSLYQGRKSKEAKGGGRGGGEGGGGGEEGEGKEETREDQRRRKDWGREGGMSK